MAKIRFITNKPLLQINVDLGQIRLMTDSEGFIELSEDHPALERMKAAFEYTEVLPPAPEPAEELIEASPAKAAPVKKAVSKKK